MTANFSYLVVMLIAVTNDVPVMAFLGEFATLEACDYSIKDADVEPDAKRRMGCMLIGREKDND